jgi:formylglycine-generating enzyme required for sulfatase activity/DNA-binding winged helix-turn-helix (wHTH) protein
LFYAFEGYGLDTERRELRRADALIPVQPQVFDLLEYLIRKRDRVVSKDDLLAAVWNGRIVSESTLASRVNAARRAIGDDGESQRLIRTLHRRGIRFVGEVREEHPETEQDIAKLLDPPSGSGERLDEPWRYSSPYRGLAAMEENDSDYFFGRSRETIEVLSVLATEPDRLPVLLGNSGVGKSSLAQAGVLTALNRQTWPEDSGAPQLWPYTLKDSHRWCSLTLRPGTKPIRSLVEAILKTWQLDRTSTEWPERCADWVEKLIGGNVNLRDLLDQTLRRYVELKQPEPAAFVLYIDQGEELYVRAEERQRRRFSELLAQALGGRSLYALMSLRADFFGELQKDEPLYNAHRLINVPPLREAALRDVVTRPAELLSARFENDRLAGDIVRWTAEESARDACALPMLSYLLDDMWTRMVHQGDGVLRLSTKLNEHGGVLVDRADAFLAAHPNSEEDLRRILTLKLATVREGEDPTRRRARRSEFTEEEWRLVSELAGHPNRLLVTTSPEGGEPYAEVAHEAIFRHWDRLRAWIAAEREFLAWRSGLEAARRDWQRASDNSKDDALLMGLALAQAQNWSTKRADDIPAADRAFIVRSREAAKRRHRRVQALVGVLAFGVVAVMIGWLNQSYLWERINWFMIMRPYMLTNVRPYALTAEAERALKPLASFRECAKDCPEMIVIPAGAFTMGSPAAEKNRYDNEGPQHQVTIASPFAVSKFDVTFAEWDACVFVGGCPPANDYGFGRDTRPVIHVSWEAAQKYVAWIAKMTGQPYRLPTEAEWEFAARAGTTTAYFWGDDVGETNAHCNGCGDLRLSPRKTTPVGSYKPNAFGLYDMAGNVWNWMQDCYHDNYNSAPSDGSAWTSGDCTLRVVRGSAWNGSPSPVRMAVRLAHAITNQGGNVGFRVARTLSYHDGINQK